MMARARCSIAVVAWSAAWRCLRISEWRDDETTYYPDLVQQDYLVHIYRLTDGSEIGDNRVCAVRTCCALLDELEGEAWVHLRLFLRPVVTIRWFRVRGLHGGLKPSVLTLRCQFHLSNLLRHRSLKGRGTLRLHQQRGCLCWQVHNLRRNRCEFKISSSLRSPKILTNDLWSTTMRLSHPCVR